MVDGEDDVSARVVKRTVQDGRVFYLIQQKHFLLRWVWEDVCDPTTLCPFTYKTREAAMKDLCWHNGTTHKDEVFYEN